MTEAGNIKFQVEDEEWFWKKPIVTNTLYRTCLDGLKDGRSHDGKGSSNSTYPSFKSFTGHMWERQAGIQNAKVEDEGSWNNPIIVHTLHITCLKKLERGQVNMMGKLQATLPMQVLKVL